MNEHIQAIFEGGVLRPLEPLNLREHEVVIVSIGNAAKDVEGSEPTSADQKRAILALLDQMERMPEKSPADDFSQRDHDRIIYGLAK